MAKRLNFNFDFLNTSIAFERAAAALLMLEQAYYNKPRMKTFDELADAWEAAVEEASTQLPDPETYPYHCIEIPVNIHPIDLSRTSMFPPDHINAEDSYVTFEKDYVGPICIGWKKKGS